MKYFAGIEGGSTASTLVVINETGQSVASIVGAATNYLLIGEDECFRRIKSMLDEARQTLNLSSDDQFEALGMCMSGCVTEEDSDRFAARFANFYPKAAKHFTAANDTVGSVYTSNSDCTGSNSILFDTNGPVTTCGGWGHLLGEKGSAYWIAKRAYKTLLDHNDGYKVSKYNLDTMRDVICKYFKLNDERSVGCFYQQMDKKQFAGLSRELYNSTKRCEDRAINDIFRQAGEILARKVVALYAKSSEETKVGGLNIICVGAVFEGWDLLERGFVNFLSEHLKNFRLLKLTKSSAFGAAKLGAKMINFNLNIGETTQLLYAYSATSDGTFVNGELKQLLPINGHSSNGSSNGTWNCSNGTIRRQDKIIDLMPLSVGQMMMLVLSMLVALIYYAQFI